MDELYGEIEGLIISFFIKSSSCLLISSLWKGENLYYLVLIGQSSVVTILIAIISVWPNSSSANWNKSLYLLILIINSIHIGPFLFDKVVQTQKYM